MEEILKKLEELGDRIKEECGKVSKRVDELREEGVKERENLKKIWLEGQKANEARTNELAKRMEKLERLAERRNQEGQAVFKEEGLMVCKETEERVRSLEISVERQEREVRRKNIIVKGVEMQRNKEWSQEIEIIWEKIGVEGGRRNMRKIGEIDKEEKGLVLI
ncbi:uncharacterized protein LOC123259723 [Cotesia glomerata]|uniref:uncharacterized protein LOC123259723 n=1 Tax=Cotesia glomerata TaxID=32391 RepID=UPI001D009085|nr:uncharacterized protein LOC123259723 [Cotesia glomerata]